MPSADEVVVYLRADTSDYRRNIRAAANDAKQALQDGAVAQSKAVQKAVADSEKQAQAAEKLAQRTAAAADRAAAAQARADEKHARFIITAQRGTDAFLASQDKLAKTTTSVAAAEDSHASKIAQTTAEIQKATTASRTFADIEKEMAEFRARTPVIQGGGITPRVPLNTNGKQKASDVLGGAEQRAAIKAESDRVIAAQKAEEDAYRRSALAAEQAARRKVLAEERAAAAAEKSALAARRAEQLRGRQALSGANQQITNTSLVGGGTVGTIIGAAAIAAGTKSLLDYADAWTTFGNRIRAAGVVEDQVATQQQKLFDVAQRSRTDLDASAALYQRLAISGRAYGLVESDLLRLTETISKSFKLGGATSAEAEGAIIQFTQALAKGKLRGQEFNSVLTQAPLIGQAIAKEFGVTTLQLKEMADKGELDAARVLKAVVAMAADTDAQFAKFAKTGADATTRFSNAFTKFIGEINADAQLTGAFNDTIDRLIAAMNDPKVIAEFTKLMEELGVAVKLVGDGIVFAVGHLDQIITGAKALVGIKLALWLVGVTRAMAGLTLALTTNPIGALIGVAAILGGVIAMDQLSSALNGAAAAASDSADGLGANTGALDANKSAAERAASAQKALADQAEDSAKRAADAAKQAEADQQRQQDQLPEGTTPGDVRMNADRQFMQQVMGNTLGIGPGTTVVGEIRQALDEALAARQQLQDQLDKTLAEFRETESAPYMGEVNDFVLDVLDVRDKGGPALEAFRATAEQALDDIAKNVGDTDGTVKDLILRLLNIRVRMQELDGTVATIKVNLVTQTLEEQLPKTGYGDVPAPGANEFFGIPLPGTRPAPPTVITPPKGGGGGKAGKAKREPETAATEKYLTQLKAETDQLSLSNTALKESQLVTEAAAKAKEDFRRKLKDSEGNLRTSAALTKDETAAIHSYAQALATAPDILSTARTQLPKFSDDEQRKQLNEMLKALTDPEVQKALAAQGLSIADATKAINLQLLTVDSSAKQSAEAVAAVGDAFIQGASSATSFADGLGKIALQLAQLLAQAAAGQGPLGGFLNQILGVGQGGSGIFSLLFPSVPAVAGATASPGGPLPGLGTGFRRSSAAGGTLAAGEGSWINEIGQEAARRGQDFFIPGRATNIIPAHETQKMLGGGTNGGPPIIFQISMAGANGDRTIAEIAAAAVKKGLQSVPEINRQHAIRFA